MIGVAAAEATPSPFVAPRAVTRPLAASATPPRRAGRPLARYLGLGLLAVLGAWAIFAPLFAYTRGRLDGYLSGIELTVNPAQEIRPALPMFEPPATRTL